MPREIVITAVLVPLAVVVGTIGWSGQAALLPAATFFPLLWARSPTRIAAALVAAGYFLAASRGLPSGVAQFFAADLWVGLSFWVAAASSFVAVHAVFWTARSGSAKARRYLLILALTGLPPLGITGWAHPLTAAGILFPGWGWWGLLALTAGLIGLASRIGPAIAIALSGLWLWSAASGTNQILAEGWRGVDLEMGASLGRDRSLERQRHLIAFVREAAGSGAAVVVLPESALGFWTPTLERLWREELRGSDVTVIAGAAVIDANGYDNVMVTINEGGGSVLYHERMPVPVSMWRPWERWTGATGGAHASFFANPVVELAGRKIAPLICYEQLVLWPILQSMLHRPDAIVLIGNGWWTTGGNIVAIQRASAKAWSALFGVPLVISFNT
ncbi:conjugal transfer protein TraB [Agrobacterium vitis]|uniref:Conjugal transfer protein TraB n=1 Tax=Agrobacterium vitis TaxID=373 RepID=A0AAE4WIK9_AGRVI|nr:conjugal transfer protein TraB [Agrobacterium vitis]MUZ60588.1 conjugal transfer protein TraB [Agrobacterium vitis]